MIGGLDGSLASRGGVIYGSTVEHADSNRGIVSRYQGWVTDWDSSIALTVLSRRG